MYNKYIYLCFMLFVSVIGRSQTFDGHGERGHS